MVINGKRFQKKPRDGLRSERLFSDWFVTCGAKITRSKKLDYDYRIDVLMTGLPGIASMPEIGIQLTYQLRKRKKIATFFTQAAKATDGFLIYIELHGDTTQKMAWALIHTLRQFVRTADLARQRRYRLSLHASGKCRWLPVPEGLEG